MWVHLKRGPLADLSTPKDQKPGDQGQKTWRFGEKPGGLLMVSKRTKTRKTNENGSLRIRLTGYEPSHSVLNFVFA